MRKNTILVLLIGVIVGAMMLSAVLPLSASAADPSAFNEKGKNPPGRSSNNANNGIKTNPGSPYSSDDYKNATDLAASKAVDQALANGWITIEQAAYLKEGHAPFGQLVKIIGGQHAQELNWSMLVDQSKTELGYPNTTPYDDDMNDDMYGGWKDWYKNLSVEDKAAYDALFKSAEVQTALKDALIAQVNAAVTTGKLTQPQAEALITRIDQLSADGKLYFGMLGIFGLSYTGDLDDDMYNDDRDGYDDHNDDGFDDDYDEDRDHDEHGDDKED